MVPFFKGHSLVFVGEGGVNRKKCIFLSTGTVSVGTMFLDRQIFVFFLSPSCLFFLKLGENSGEFPKYRRTCQVMSFDITLILALGIYHTWMFFWVLCKEASGFFGCNNKKSSHS